MGVRFCIRATVALDVMIFKCTLHEMFHIIIWSQVSFVEVRVYYIWLWSLKSVAVTSVTFFQNLVLHKAPLFFVKNS